MIAARASDAVAILPNNNLVGGQDELVFDGHSCILMSMATLSPAATIEEDFIVADLDIESVFRARLHDPRWRKESPVLEKTGWHQTKTIVSLTLLPIKKPRSSQEVSLPWTGG